MLKNYHFFGESQDLIGKYQKVMMNHREKREGDHKGHSAEAEGRSFLWRFGVEFKTLRQLERMVPSMGNYEWRI